MSRVTRLLFLTLTVVVLLGCPKRPGAVDPDVDPAGPAARPEQGGNAAQDVAVDVKTTSEAATAFDAAVARYEQGVKTGKVDFDEAIRGFEDAAKADPKLGVALFNAGALEEQRGNQERAEDYYTRAMQADPGLDQPVVNLALMQLRRGDAALASRTLNGAVARNPDASEPRLLMARMALGDGRIQQAFKLAKKALAHNARSIEAYRVLAEIALLQKQVSMAKLLILKGYKINPEDPFLQYLMAETMFAEGESSAGIAELHAVLQKRDDFLPARVQLGQIAMQQRDFGTAAAQYKAIADSQPGDYGPWVNLGIALKGQANFDGARQAYNKALEIKKGAPEALFGLAVIELRHNNEPARARELLREYMKSKPGLPNKHPAYGMLQEADVLIQAKVEEKRQMELMKRQQEEMERQEAQKKAQQGSAEGEGPKAGAEPAESAQEGDSGEAKAAEPAAAN